MRKIFNIILVLSCYLLITGNAFSQSSFIRVNQVGFLPGDLKTAALMSAVKMDGKPFNVVDLSSGKNIFSGKIASSVPGTGSFKYLYYIDFSPVKNPGS
ncbi:MAG: cellulase N-terminal Ig-like domain-containing protein, partial [Syntrophothermus sp.]